MKKQLIKTLIFFLVLLLIISGVFFVYIKRSLKEDESKNSLVLLNEIKALTTDEDGENIAKEQLEILIQKESSYEKDRKEYVTKIIVFYICFDAVYIFAAFLYIYLRIINPFGKLEKYAGELAKGNFDVDLKYERKNFFGAFTWCFDHMRGEIVRARKNEARAVEENKLIIATLSHDIKTPIASIRAYAEGLEAAIDNSYEKRVKYTGTIIRKCDEVTKLTNDLVLHSLSELDKLEFNIKSCNLKNVIEEAVRDMNYDMVKIEEPIHEAYALIDKKRMAQVIENILNNAKKYAGGYEVRIWTIIKEDTYEIHIKDGGNGIPDEDVPFIFNKFYRGKNTENIEGSGLGLYIVKYIMEKMDADVELNNSREGLEIILKFLKIS